jgi:hypothetical protein
VKVQNIFEIISTDKVTLIKYPSSTIDYDVNKIESIWKKKYSKNNKILFNDKTLIFNSLDQRDKELVVKGSFIDYKLALSSRIEPSLGVDVKQIGVSGIIIFRDNEEYILFSTRSHYTIEYPNFIELVPSGHIDESTVFQNGTIDYISKLIEEFHEETGLSVNVIKNIKCLGFVFDKIGRVYDICCVIEIDSSMKEIENSFKTVSEYLEPKFIPLESLSDFINTNFDRIVPTSLAILSILQKQKS